MDINEVNPRAPLKMPAAEDGRLSSVKICLILWYGMTARCYQKVYPKVLRISIYRVHDKLTIPTPVLSLCAFMGEGNDD